MAENTNNLQYEDSKFHIENAVLNRVEGTIPDGGTTPAVMLDADFKVNGKFDNGGVIQETIDNSEFVQVTTDSEGKIIEATRKDGKKVFYGGIEGVASEEEIIALQQEDTRLQEEIDNITIQELGGVISDQGQSNRGKALVVGNDGIVTTGPTIIQPTNVDGVTYETQKTLYLGSNLLTSDSQISLGSGWSGNLNNGITHSSGSAGNFTINVPCSNTRKYLLRYDSDVLGEYTLLIDIEDLNNVDPYNGDTHINLGFKSNGNGTLVFKATDTYAGTISNLQILPLVEEAEAVEEYVISTKNVNAGSLNSNITGWINVALGPDNALSDNENGSRNIAIGSNSLVHLRAGTRNIGIGTFSMLRLVNGERNIAIGADALYWAKEAEDNIVIGKAALANMGVDHANPKRNIVIGTQALLGNQAKSSDNIAIGYRALASSPDSQNVAIGNMSGYWLRGKNNVTIGHNAQKDNFCTGDNNTVIGAGAKAYIAGGTAESPTTISNAIAIGYGVQASKSNQCVIGNSSVSEFIFGNKKIKFNSDHTVTWEEV